ncbi:hypothetical protein BaRGS_00032342 [Batillaria attramentaria]|uniref:Uncharacterized protein n=1 Tax=Batillaria attramentaria TaxID=370345 RepID=A0ABD0JPL7_9CAEN
MHSFSASRSKCTTHYPDYIGLPPTTELIKRVQRLARLIGPQGVSSSVIGSRDTRPLSKTSSPLKTRNRPQCRKAVAATPSDPKTLLFY